MFFIRSLWLTLSLISISLAGEYTSLHTRLANEFALPAAEVRAMETWLDSSARKCTDIATEAQKLECMRKAIYQDLGMKFDSLVTGPVADVFPTTAFKVRHGSCVPVAFLTIMLAERCNVKATPISLPGHVYLRFAGGRNWEPNLNGVHHPDAYYANAYHLDPVQGLLAIPLDVKGFEGFIRFEVANRLAMSKDFSGAVTQFGLAQTLSKDPRIPGNRAIALDQQGRGDLALGIMDSLWKVGMRSEPLVWNRALLSLQQGRSNAEVQAFLREAQRTHITSHRLDSLATLVRQHAH